VPIVPYVGDRVVLLTCPGEVRERLRAIGFHGGDTIDADGADVWLDQLAAEGGHLTAAERAARMGAWLEVIRNQAAMTGRIATVWLPAMPETIARAVRKAAGSELIEINAGDEKSAIEKIAAYSQPQPDTAGKVFAVTSIRNGGIDLLPHWLEHYTKLGVDRILLGIFDDVPAANRDRIEEWSRRWPLTMFRQTWKDQHELAHEEQRRSACRLAGAGPETWIVHTDLDELHEFPAPLGEIIATCEVMDINTVSGEFLDRVAADGTLGPVLASPSLWGQFPVGCRLTKNLLRGWTRKVMLAKFCVACGVGHHVGSNVKAHCVPIGRPDQYIVHHFKWHAELPGRMEWAMSQPNANVMWRIEARKFLNWLKFNGGRINLGEAALAAKAA
jgi:Glycosyl transferase family 2